ncbi:hypothetical protein BsWGS_12815 [Bradybaena similaris]
MKYNNLTILSNNSFWNLSQLEILDLSNNNLALYTTNNLLSVEPGFLVPLISLQMFDFSMNEQRCLEDLVPLLRSITQSNITNLRMQSIVNPYMPCVAVSNIFAEVLPRGLQELLFSSNSLTVIWREVFTSLPKNLTYVDISDNRLTFGSYLKYFSKCENLNVLKLNGGDFSFALPTAYPSHEGNSCKCIEMRSSKSTGSRRISRGTILKLPRNLKTVEIKIAGWSYSLTAFKIDPNNTLTSLTLNGNNIPELVGPLTGLTSLKELELADCNVDHISDDFFCDFLALEKLNLSRNRFGHLLAINSTRTPFKCLHLLKELDLSFALILTVSENALMGLSSLRKLYMQSNALHYFTANISHMRDLCFINFSFTELAKLNTDVIGNLDGIIRNRNTTITIDLGEAPIRCECDNLEFLGWLVTSKLNLTNERNKCVFADTTEQRVADTFHGIYKKLQRECTPRLGMFVGVFGFTVLAIITITASIVYRFRWKLRYLYYSAYLSLKSKDKQTDNMNHFEYDVFISYVSEDHTFVIETLYPKLQAGGLKVHVHGLHFVAGEHIASNILNAVQSSRYTLVVLTRQLLDSVWCKYELQMANMEHVYTGRPVLVFLLMENLTQKELGTELLYHIQSSTYVRYPETTEQLSEQQMDIFWSKLTSDLRS